MELERLADARVALQRAVRMQRFGLIAGVVILCVCAGIWLTPALKGESDGWRFAQSEISLGKLTTDQDREVDFEVENGTDKPIKIVSAAGSCRCTSLEYAPEEIPAHGAGTIKFMFSASRAEGPVSEDVMVEAADGRTLQGTFTADVEEPAVTGETKAE